MRFAFISSACEQPRNIDLFLHAAYVCARQDTRCRKLGSSHATCPIGTLERQSNSADQMWFLALHFNMPASLTITHKAILVAVHARVLSIACRAHASTYTQPGKWEAHAPLLWVMTPERSSRQGGQMQFLTHLRIIQHHTQGSVLPNIFAVSIIRLWPTGLFGN